MMRVLLLVAFMTVAVLAHGGGSHFHPADFPRSNGYYDSELRRFESLVGKLRQHKAVLKPNPLECAICEDIVPGILDMVGNATENEKLVGILSEKICHDKSPTWKSVCHGAVEMVLGLGEILVSELGHLNFNLTEVICADLLGTCSVKCCLTEHEPEQIHISFASKKAAAPVTNMQVAWVTGVNTTNPAVYWRAAGSSAPWNRAAAVTRTYTIAGWLGMIYGSQMTGLAANSSYEYFVGSDEANSTTAVFKTLPTNAGSPARPLKILAVADMGYSAHSVNTRAVMQQQVNTGEIDFMLHTGDISYADGDQARFDIYMREMQDMVRRVPYVVGPGNHEAFYNFTAYKQRFFTPLPGDGAPTDAMYYAFEIGNQGFVMLDSEWPFQLPRMDDVQVAWFEKQLIDFRNRGMGILVGFHRPLYCSEHGSDCGAFADYLRERIEPLMTKYQVDLVHVGHMHNYERTLPAYNGSATASSYVNPPNPTYIVNGAGGCVEGTTGFNGPFKQWSAYRTTDTGFMTMEFSVDPTKGSRSLAGTFIRASDNTETDHFVIQRS